MARKLVTREDVFAIADALHAEGATPSSTRIYQRLGHGSLSTITRYLRTWELLRTSDEKLDSAASSVPSSLYGVTSRLVTKLWQTAKEEADNELADQRRELDEREASWREEVESAQSIANQAIAARVAAEQKTLEARQELERFRHDFGELMEGYDAVMADRDLLRDKSQAQGEKITTLRHTLTDCKKQSQECQWQNEQQAKQISLLTGKSEQLDHQLRDAQRELAKVTQHRDDLQHHADDLGSRLLASQDRYDQLENDIRETNQRLAEAQKSARAAEESASSSAAALQDYQQAVSRLEATLAARDEALQDSKVEKEELAGRLRDTENSASELNGRVLAQQEQVRQLYRELGKCQRQLGLRDTDDPDPTAK